MRRMSRAAGALKTALGRRGSIRSKILAGFTVTLVGMLSINLLVIGLSHHFLGEYHILAERVISANKLIPTVRDDVSLDAYYLVAGRRTLETTQLFHHMEEIRQRPDPAADCHAHLRHPAAVLSEAGAGD